MIRRDGVPRAVEVRAIPHIGSGLHLVCVHDRAEPEPASASLHAHAQQHAVVARLGQLALSGIALETLMETAVHLVTITLEIELSAIFELIPGEDALLLRTGVGWNPDCIGRARTALTPEHIVGRTIANGEAVIVESLRSDPRFVSETLLSNHDIESSASVLIPGSGRPFGVLTAHSVRSRTFSGDDVHFLESVANVLATADIRKEEEQVRVRLLERVVSTQEEERRRLARELHNETGQSLTALLIGLLSIEQARRIEEVAPAAHRLRSITARTLEDVGRLARGLHPVLLDDLGLIEAAARLALDFSDSFGTPVEFRSEGTNPGRLPAVLETTVYHLLQESLTNCARHAKATTISASLSLDDVAVTLVVKDDGIGFDVASVTEGSAGARRLGLHYMRESVALLGGWLRLESKVGAGTVVSARIPIHGRSKRGAHGRMTPGGQYAQ